MSDGEKLHQILVYIDEKNGVSADTNEIALALALTQDDAYRLTSTLIQNNDVRDCSSKSNYNEGTLEIFSIAATKSALLSGKYNKKPGKLLTYYGPSTNRPTLFISYCWANSAEAETIYKDLTQVGIQVKKDTHDLIYKDNLNEFMRSIRDADFAVVLISDAYLKSKNCLTEVLHLLKEKEVKQKILPVLIDGTRIYSTSDRLIYIQYWEEQEKSLDQESRRVRSVNSIEVLKDLKTVGDIAGSIDSFLKEVSSMLIVEFNKLKSEAYLQLLTAMNYENVTWATDLLEIIGLTSVQDREIALDEYITKHRPNSFYYTVKATTNTKDGRYKQAKSNFLQAIKLDDKNVEALNDLGYLLDFRFKEHKLARQYYEAALKVDPTLTVARLNLGVLLADKFSDIKGAKKQYKAAIENDPKDARAYNNLASLYRNESNNPTSQDKAIRYLKRAIEIDPTYLEAYLNYGNLLKVRGDTNAGNTIYDLGKQYDRTGDYARLIETLKKSGKG